MPKCGSPCLLENLVSFIPSRVPSDWYAECGLSQPTSNVDYAVWKSKDSKFRIVLPTLSLYRRNNCPFRRERTVIVGLIDCCFYAISNQKNALISSITIRFTLNV